MKSLYYWAGRYVHKPYAWAVFTLLVFIEAFLFMPSSTLFIIFGLEKRKHVFMYATLATIGSIIGAATAYAVGFFVWDIIGKVIVESVMNPASFNRLITYFREYQTYGVLLVGFLPFPYKAITLTAGFCRLPFIPFIVCCAISRAARFFILGIALSYWGHHIQEIIDRYFYYLVVLGIGILILSGWLVH